MPAFVFEEVAHASASRQHQLRDIFDNLGLFLRRECGEPFREALLWGIAFSLASSRRRGTTCIPLYPASTKG